MHQLVDLQGSPPPGLRRAHPDEQGVKQETCMDAQGAPDKTPSIALNALFHLSEQSYYINYNVVVHFRLPGNLFNVNYLS